MLTRRTLNFPGDRHTVAGSLLRRELFEQCQLAEQILEQAREQAQQLLDTAREQTVTLHRQACEQARTEVMAQAAALLDALREQREQVQAAVLEVAHELVGTALEQLLGEQPPAQRIETVLQHLLQARTDEPQARLHCHPERVAQLTLSLQARGLEGWQVQGDALLALDALSLRTGHGEFNLDWQWLVQHALP